MRRTVILIGVAVVSAIGAPAAASPLVFAEDIPCFREGIDSWRVNPGASGGWDDNGRFSVFTADSGFSMEYSRYPGMKPFAGAREMVLIAEFDGDILPATAELVIAEFPGGKKLSFHAPLAREIRFATELDPSRQYQLGSIGVHRDAKDGQTWNIAFSSLHGVFATTKAHALRVEAETGNPLRIAREECGEVPFLHIRNAAQERIVAHGALKVTGFCGEAPTLPIDVSLEGGESVDIPVPGCQSKGVWHVTGELEANDGSTAKVDTRFAVMTYHDKSPKRPRGTFRLGVLWHIQRYTPEDRRICAAAMVACGAKLTRADMATMSSIQHGGPDCWDFARTDELMDTLESNGISLDAIIFHIPKWAANPEKQTNTNWRAWTWGRPIPGTFARFCERLATRYGTRIDYYEIGNEWDLEFFFP